MVEGDEAEVVVVVELFPTPGRREELIELSRLNSQRVINIRVGCRSFTIDDQGPDGPVVVLTKWDSREALGAHLQSAMAADNIDSYVGLLVTPLVPQVMPARSYLP